MKTCLDLQLSAEKAARTTLDMTSDLEVTQAMVGGFKAEGGEAEDWNVWRDYFINDRNACLSQRRQPAPSAKAESAPKDLSTPKINNRTKL